MRTKPGNGVVRHAIGALCACFVFVFPAVSPAADTIAFAGVEWRSTVASVKRVMAERGFTLENVDQDGDLEFTGTAFGDKSTVFALFNTRGELVKWSVVFRIPDHRAVHRYRELKAQLSAQYGDPFGEIEEWEYPYDDGGQVGHEATAIRLGKGALKAGWQTVGTSFPSVVIEVTGRLTVRASYEGPGWEAEAAYRQAKNSVF